MSGRFQRVVLNGQTSDWETICAGAMVFNSDPTKQAQEVIFSIKSHSAKDSDLHLHNLVLD